MLDPESAWRRLRAECFDVLVVGAGAVGCGCALDAAARGLRVALVEAGDIASGSSSRSTKLLHGGVRYLEQAVLRADRAQLTLVQDGLAERALNLRLAPHLARRLTLVTPAADVTQRAWLAAGLELYDRLAGRRALGSSRPVSCHAVRARWPELAGTSGGAVLYHDGAFDDARFAVGLARRAVQLGTVLRTRSPVVGLMKDQGRISGALVEDPVSRCIGEVRASAVINATGPGADRLRRLDEADCPLALRLSAGAHIALDRSWWPHAEGLLLPRSRDGRVAFLLPFAGSVLVGTTDEPSGYAADPQPSAAGIAQLLAEASALLGRRVPSSAVRAAWCGLRPLLAAGDGGTAGLVRDHRVLLSRTGLVTITGGKWTTWRLMARDAVDAACRRHALSARVGSRTHRIRLPGADGFVLDELPLELRRIPADCAWHLHRAYGSEAPTLLAAVGSAGGERLLPGKPWIAAELSWAVQVEGARTAEDILHRRLRIGAVDAAAAAELAGRCRDLLAGC